MGKDGAKVPLVPRPQRRPQAGSGIAAVAVVQVHPDLPLLVLREAEVVPVHLLRHALELIGDEPTFQEF